MSAVDKIAEVIHDHDWDGARTCTCGWNERDADYRITLYDHRTEAVVAAIRDMSPSDLAELIGGSVQRGIASSNTPAITTGYGNQARWEHRVIGPWIAD